MLKNSNGNLAGTLYVTREGMERVTWRENLTLDEAEALIEEWEDLMNAADGEGPEAQEAEVKLEDIPMMEGADVAFESVDGRSFYHDGQWTEY